MKSVRVLGLVSILLPILAVAQEQEAEENEFSMAGFNKVRIEQEDKITVPAEKADEAKRPTRCGRTW
jgi:hypothetical protein